MLQALLVTFREGLESLLIVGVIAGYLRKTGRTRLLTGLRVGLVVSIATCLVGAYLWQFVPNQPLYEGIAALSAAVMVGLLLWQMMRVGRRMKQDIEARLARVAGAQPAAPADGAAAESAGAGSGAGSLAAVAGVALVTMLLVTREGLEAVLYLGIQARMSGGGGATLIGAAIGLVLAAATSWIWTRYAHALNLRVVLRVTAVFLALFLFQLLVYGVHELAESGFIEGSERFHDATEVFGPQGAIGHVLSYSLVAAPLLYLLWNTKSRPARSA